MEHGAATSDMSIVWGLTLAQLARRVGMLALGVMVVVGSGLADAAPRSGQRVSPLAAKLPPVPMSKGLAAWLPGRNPIRRRQELERLGRIGSQDPEPRPVPRPGPRRRMDDPRRFRDNPQATSPSDRANALSDGANEDIVMEQRARPGSTAALQKRDVGPRVPPPPAIVPRRATPNAGSAVRPDRDGKSKPLSADPDGGNADTAKTEEPEPDVWPAAAIQSAMAACSKALSPLSIEVNGITPVKRGGCGDPAMVEFSSLTIGQNTVRFRPALKLNCRTIVAFHDWLRNTALPAARTHLNKTIVGIRGVGGYTCRNRYGRKVGKLSEHAFGNAIDIPVFVFADKTRVSVLNGWGPTKRDLEKQLAATPNPADAKPAADTRAIAGGAKSIVAPIALSPARQTQMSPQKLAPPLPTRRPSVIASRRRQQARRRISRAAPRAGSRVVTRNSATPAAAKPAPSRPDGPKRPQSARRSDQRAEALSPPKRSPRAIAEANFLRALFDGACKRFGTVLGPESNEAHRNHFHFDMAKRRRRAYCR